MLRKWLALLGLALAATVSVAADRIERVEPPSWWVGMKDDRLQLLVYGQRVAELQPEIAHPGVTITGTERVDNPDYLFVNLRIAPETAPGPLQIVFRKGKTKVASRTYVLNAREPGSAARAGFGPRDVIYLAMPDRFANADPTNDSVAGMHDKLDRARSLGRHGGDIKGIEQHLDYIAGMGFTQLWLNPVLENNQPEIDLPRLRDQRLLQGRSALRRQRGVPATRRRGARTRRGRDQGRGPEPCGLRALVDAGPAVAGLVQQRQHLQAHHARP